MNPYDNNDYEPITSRQAATYRADGMAERIVIPVLKAGIVALPAGLLAALIVGAFHVQVNGWYTFGIVTLSVFLLTFWAGSSRGQWLIERLTGADLNGDGFIGAPQQPMLPEPQPVRIEVISDQGRRSDYIDLPYPEKLPALAAGLLAGRQFAQTAWCGQGGVFSRNEFDNVRDILIARGLAAWKNPQAKAQGVTLTAAGRVVMRHLANQSPTLPDGNGRE